MFCTFNNIHITCINLLKKALNRVPFVSLLIIIRKKKVFLYRNRGFFTIKSKSWKFMLRAPQCGAT